MCRAVKTWEKMLFSYCIEKVFRPKYVTDISLKLQEIMKTFEKKKKRTSWLRVHPAGLNAQF